MNRFLSRFRRPAIPAAGHSDSSGRRRIKRRGAATAEAALCLPILVLLTLGVIEACDAMFARQALLVSAYEGARVAIVPGATAENVEAQIKKISDERKIIGTAFEINPPNFKSRPSGTLITITVRAPAKDNCFFGMGFFSRSTLEASVSMMTEY
jgi:hypothetical protein